MEFLSPPFWFYALSPSKMGNPHIDNTDPNVTTLIGVDPKDHVTPLDEFKARSNPTCKNLQQDLEKVHNIVRNTNAEILSSMNKGFAALTKLLTDDNDGVISRFRALETSSKTYDDRLAAVEEKLAKVESSDNVTLQASPALEAAVADANRR